tara:strand:- start:363 stop:551 length:189 start_codon:yes stop_codon:yes gene_type:complete
MKFIFKSIIAIIILIPATYGIFSYLGHQEQAHDIIEEAPQKIEKALDEGKEKLKVEITRTIL